MQLLPIVMSPLEVLFEFLPFELRRIQSRGIQVFDLYYWHSDLAPLIGEKKPREVRYDPRDVSRVYMRGTDGQVKVCTCTSPDIKEISLFELRDRRRRRKAAADDPAQRAIRHAGSEANDALVDRSVAATKAARRKAALEEERQKAAKQTASLNGVNGSPDQPPDQDFDPSAPIPDFTTDHSDLIDLVQEQGDSHVKG